MVLAVGFTGSAVAQEKCIPESEVRQIIQFATADGPIPLTRFRHPLAGSDEYADAMEAAWRLESAARSLAHCARHYSPDDDCYRQIQDVRDASDDYEAAANALNGLMQ